VRSPRGWWLTNTDAVSLGAGFHRWVTGKSHPFARPPSRLNHCIGRVRHDLSASSANAENRPLRGAVLGALDRALLLDPNLTAAWFLGCFVQIMRGEPDNAIERLWRMG
jgi:hypothetical protein